MSAALATRTDLAAREAAIVTLLERHAELTDPVRSGNGYGTGGLTLMPHAKSCGVYRMLSKRWPTPLCTCHLASVAEVERLLGLMRSRAKQEAYHGEPLGTLRFHVLAWYVNAVRVGQWQPKHARKGRKLNIPTGQDILRDFRGRTLPAEYREHWLRHPDARKPKADLGVAWMAERWQLGHEPMRPVEEAA